jgi:hypothetical protein
MKTNFASFQLHSLVLKVFPSSFLIVAAEIPQTLLVGVELPPIDE